MDEKIYKIILTDGTVLDNLTLNGNNYVSKKEITADIFRNNCSTVRISDGENEVTYSNMELVQLSEMENEYWFILREVSEEEIYQKAFMSGITLMAGKTLSDEEALTVIAIFPSWSPDSVNYIVGDRVKYEEKLYKCLSAHTSQLSWNPAVSPSIWVRVDDPAIEWPDWVQPTGATDAYTKGAKVTHKEKHWISDMDANVWEPGVSGWTEHIE